MNIFEDFAQRFEREMLDACRTKDIEIRHRVMDNIMCDFLEEIGCTEGVKIFKETKRWYS